MGLDIRSGCRLVDGRPNSCRAIHVCRLCADCMTRLVGERVGRS
jgi:hypothetical protein